MINNFEVQFDPKACKYYLDAYDVIFVDDQHELRFCRYCKPRSANISGKYHMVVKDNNQIFDYITRDRALCFYDIDRHRWCSKVDEHRTKCWQVIRPDDDIFINVLVGIAIDEISGSKTCLSVDDITHRIKSRFGIWYDEYTYCGIPGTRNNAEEAYRYFDEKIRSEVKKTLNESYGIRGQKYAQVRYQSYPCKPKPLPPQPKLLQFNGDYTTVVWEDGSHTVVKKCADDKADDEKAILFAIVKHLCRDNGCEMDRYLNKFFEHGKIVHKED